MRYGEVKRYLESHGWVFSHVTGSHHLFRKPGFRSYPAPVHKGQVKDVYYREIQKICEGQ